jgi:polysaccharide export outer membrane protein
VSASRRASIGRLSGLAAGAVLAVLGCASSPGPIPQPETVPYRIGPSDEMTILVLPDPSIEREVLVQPDGTFSFDLIGEVKASSRTPEEVATEIEERIAEFRVSPSVTVSLRRASSSSVTVLGEVRSRGMYPVERDLRVSDAIARGGGLTDFAAARRVRLVRREGDQATTYLANLDHIHKGDLSTDYVITRGDMIYVPPATSVEAGYAIARALYPLEVISRIFLAPFFGLAAIAGN